MSQDKIIIVGGGGAGISAAQAIRSVNSTIPVTIVTKESIKPYFRPVLTSLLENLDGENKKGFFVKDDQWFSENNIEFITDFNVANIDTEKKTLVDSNGVTLPWSKLILATGSEPLVIPDAFRHRKNVFTVRTIEDTRKLYNFISGVSSVLISGGGLLGLEAAWYILKRGITVHVSEYFKRLLPRQLDEDGGAYLTDIISKSGVKLHTGACIKDFSGETNLDVVLDNGEELKAGCIIYSVGVKSAFPELTPYPPKIERGIIVDDHMCSSIDNIYACGDCAQFGNFIPALWMVALKQGETAGKNAAGGDAIYQHQLYPAMLKAFDTHVMSVGFIEGNFIEHRTANSFMRLFYDESGNSKGAWCIGDPQRATRLIKMVKDSSPAESSVFS